MAALPPRPHTTDSGLDPVVPLVPLLTALREAVFVVDATERVVLWSPTAERLLETPAANALGRPFRDLDVSYRIPGICAAMDRARRERDPVDLPTAEVERDGAVRTMAGIVAPVADAKGAAAGVTVVLWDETTLAQMRAENAVLHDELMATARIMESTLEELQVTNEELRTTNDELAARVAELEAAQETDRHKNEFLAMLAHELRNPLAAITSAMRVFRHHASAAPELQHADEIMERQVKHQARLLDDLLDASRITRGKIDLRRSRVDLTALVTESIGGMQADFDARQVALSPMVPDAPIVVDADPTRLTQVFGNLLSNAAKYTPSGGAVYVSVFTAGEEAVVRVRDSGVGIPPDMLPRVFDLFMQVSPSLARSEGGLGIGLTLVRTLVELHGGSVSAHSAGPGQGSEFVVRLPLAAPMEATAPAPPSAPSPTRQMLIVEDNGDARDMLRICLELEGHRVDTAADGIRGVEAALAKRPEIALIDIGLPGLDGYEVARRIRQTLGHGITLIALTGYGQGQDRRRASEAGFDAHLVKPVDPEDLSRMLAAVPPRAA